MSYPTLAELPPPPPGKTGWPWNESPPPVTDLLPGGSPWPRISVVTPSYNQAQFLEETIRSVLLQGYPDLEYMIMDGGSTDGSAEIIRRYEPWLACWVSEQDAGQTDAINKGLRRATAGLLAYLNSDDIYLPGVLCTVARHAQAHPEAGLFYGDCQVIDTKSQLLGFMPRHEFNLQRTIKRGEFIPQQSAFWRRKAMDKVGLFDASLHYSMDYEFFIRVGMAFPVVYIPVTLACFRLHVTSKTALQGERHWRETLSVSERYGVKPWTAWYWIRRLRHWGLRALPAPVGQWVRRKMARAHDPFLINEGNAQ